MGAVRDSFLQRPVIDIDAATDLMPQEVIERLSAADIHAIPTGLEHGTVTAEIDKKTIEITTLRIDTITHGRHADVAFTQDWQEDAKRRDFTMNALYLAPSGQLYDPVGGLADLRAVKLCFIGEPTERIQEDALRILRYFRFYAHLPSAQMEAVPSDIQTAIGTTRAMLGQLSRERVRDELCKTLLAPYAVYSIKMMQQMGIGDALALDITAAPFCVFYGSVSTYTLLSHCGI